VVEGKNAGATSISRSNDAQWRCASLSFLPPCAQEMSRLAKLFYPDAGIASVSFSVNDRSRSCATMCRTDRPEASTFISRLFSSATGQSARVDSDSGGWLLECPTRYSISRT